MEPWTQRGLTDSSWEKGEGGREHREGKESTAKENRKLCGILNSSLEMNAFVLSLTFSQTETNYRQNIGLAFSIYLSFYIIYSHQHLGKTCALIKFNRLNTLSTCYS